MAIRCDLVWLGCLSLPRFESWQRNTLLLFVSTYVYIYDNELQCELDNNFLFHLIVGSIPITIFLFHCLLNLSEIMDFAEIHYQEKARQQECGGWWFTMFRGSACSSSSSNVPSP